MRAADARFPGPTDRAAARLVRRLRDNYEVGNDTWKNLADGVLTELRNAHDVGATAAVWIVKRSLAGFRWELSFWMKETGVTAPEPTASALEQLSVLPTEWQPNPYNSANGIHPYIHLIAALELLTARPRSEVVEALEDLLELWLAYTELDERLFGIHPRNITLLESLVKCYRASRNAEGVKREAPEFLVSLSGRRVSRSVDFLGGPDVLRGFASLFRRYSLNSLAKRALR
ncbi:hypothetical protein ABT063_51260 [Streptomyces sp. NPDC002838]|uniref:hypothetical protein n=1 Tax=Streptomyces sp. NPDC002838 TaxID=3154436 RepID=UPI00331E22B1